MNKNYGMRVLLTLFMIVAPVMMWGQEMNKKFSLTTVGFVVTRSGKCSFERAVDGNISRQGDCLA